MADKALILVFCIAYMAALDMASANPFVPDDSDFVITNVDKVDKEALSEKERLEMALWHLSKSTQPFQVVDHVTEAKKYLDTIEIQPNNMSDYLYAQARLQQHQHDFEQALGTLDVLNNFNPRHGGAWLMKASIHSIRGEFEEAKKACKKTFGLLDASIGFVCVLDISALSGDVEKSFVALSSLAKSMEFADPETQEWLAQIVASQALQLGKFDEAAKWVQRIDIKRASLSALSLWADIYLRSGEKEKVLRELESLLLSKLPSPDDIHFIDDAVLLRLAIASKNSPQGRDWIKVLDKRMKLRFTRNDQTHLAEYARYFIDVKEDKEQAMYWAELNWKQSKLYEDKNLLRSAALMVED